MDTWFSDWQVSNGRISLLQIRVIVNNVKIAIEDVTFLDKCLTPALEGVFDKSTVHEWLGTYLDPLLKQLTDCRDRGLKVLENPPQPKFLREQSNNMTGSSGGPRVTFAIAEPPPLQDLGIQTPLGGPDPLGGPNSLGMQNPMGVQNPLGVPDPIVPVQPPHQTLPPVPSVPPVPHGPPPMQMQVVGPPVQPQPIHQMYNDGGMYYRGHY